MKGVQRILGPEAGRHEVSSDVKVGANDIFPRDAVDRARGLAAGLECSLPRGLRAQLR